MLKNPPRAYDLKQTATASQIRAEINRKFFIFLQNKQTFILPIFAVVRIFAFIFRSLCC